MISLGVVMAIVEQQPDENSSWEPVYTQPTPGPWSPQTKRTAACLGFLAGLFMGWQLGLPDYEPANQADRELLSAIIREHIEASIMNDQTDIRDFLPPLTEAEIRIEDKVLELQRLLDYGRKYYPLHAKAKKGVVEVAAPVKRSEAFSRIAILKAILADYEHQLRGQASYEEAAKRLGEKE